MLGALPGSRRYRGSGCPPCRRDYNPDREVPIFELDYQAAGTGIFCLHSGPGGVVYGPSVLPEHFFFRYDPAAGEMADLGGPFGIRA